MSDSNKYVVRHKSLSKVFKRKIFIKTFSINTQKDIHIYTLIHIIYKPANKKKKLVKENYSNLRKKVWKYKFVNILN